MVVGKRINNNSTWKLGDESIEEVNEYKYLGYFVNRTLKSNFHICNFLKEKADKHLNYIKVITKLPNSEQSYKGKVKTHNYINRQNQSTTGKL